MCLVNNVEKWLPLGTQQGKLLTRTKPFCLFEHQHQQQALVRGHVRIVVKLRPRPLTSYKNDDNCTEISLDSSSVLDKYVTDCYKIPRPVNWINYGLSMTLSRNVSPSCVCVRVYACVCVCVCVSNVACVFKSQDYTSMPLCVVDVVVNYGQVTNPIIARCILP